MTFYNTIHETGKALETSKEKAKSQDQRITTYFKSNTEVLLTPSEVRGYVFGNSIPVTSVRRSMTNLTKSGILEKTSLMRKGDYNKMSHCWKLNDNLKPQLNIFDNLK